MLGRCIEDPSNSVIHKCEKFIYDHDARRIKAAGLSNILINISFISNIYPLYPIYLNQYILIQYIQYILINISFLRACFFKRIICIYIAPLFQHRYPHPLTIPQPYMVRNFLLFVILVIWK